MIRFCDKEVYSVYEEELDKVNLFSFFCGKGHSTDIILVINYQEEFVGIITYERMLYDRENLIQKQRLIADEEIWSNAGKIFAENKNIIFIPVYNKKHELIYFCYKSNFPSDYSNIIRELDKNEDLLFINELYPQIQVVYIHDLNEMAFRFYKLLLKRKIPTVVVGEKWKHILGIDSQIIECSSYSKMEIYAEGTPFIKEDKEIYDKNRFVAPNVWGFLLEIANVNRIVIENKIKKDYRYDGKKVFICRLPMYDELINCTLEEEYRHLKGINIVNSDLDFKNDLINNQIVNIYNMGYMEVNNKINVEKARQRGQKLHYSKNIKKLGTGDNIIYLIGPCIVEGLFNFEKEELLYYLFHNLNREYNGEYSIVGIAISEEQCGNLREIVNSISIRDNDIIIFLGSSFYSLCKKFDINDSIDLNLKELFNTRSKNETWFMDGPIHTTGIANKAISNELTEKIIKPEIDRIDFTKESRCLQLGKVYLSNKEKENLYKYINNIQKYKFNVENNERVGSIVMNCNPITLGHMHLIEYARKNVDWLYIFVVEEDKSFFKFNERYELVEKAIKNMENVKAIPSGQFILSNKTMPSYFTKEYEQEQIIDASEDVRIFAEYIAPQMNIDVRFAGEEPLDNITNQYNFEMRRTLTDYGIKFIEIPRKKASGEVISASRVRKLLKSDNMNEIQKLVPDVTFKYLVNMKK
ncbi:adenylyltransferase/cytidyltransferase family protein [Clostridium beijerinckii]|uniref:adenylyltransferase/cytidyltransferase family protein n=1 Tax=Clostridium beijerinckii TaxID=1520 RepID=UPI000686DFE2|nr:adenylyltransferase/cytidyltransferase family protein [Clostridium beijerinckii]